MTLSLRPDDRGALRSMQKWPNSGGGWGNHHHQHGPMLEPSMSPLYSYASHQLQASQSMFPQLMSAADQQAALLQAFVQANAGEQQGGSLDSLLNSSRSSSMVDTSSEMSMTPGDDDICTAPENNLHNMTCVNPGLASVILASRLDHDGASLMNGAQAHDSKEYSFRMGSPGGPLSPCGEPSEDSGQLHGGDHAMAGRLKRCLGDGDEHENDPWMADQIMVAREKLQKFHRHLSSEKAPVFQDGFGEFQAPSEAVTYSSAMQPPPPPFLQTGNGGGSEVASDMGKMVSMRAMLFRHASQPIPSLEEIASSRPKRRNVRISKDPQSVAARHRRERISDRMRVLQRLVPGGTKMDTASMLDEAIHYVKFLKLQLQTLEQMGSSDGCDPRFPAQQGGNSGAAQELVVSLARPFDLNCSTAAFQTWPGAPATTVVNSSEAAQQTCHRTQWASDANQASFSDHATM